MQVRILLGVQIERKMVEIVNGYYATEEGEIWSKRKNKNIAKKLNNRGYYLVNLSISGKVKTYQLHRLIATAFIENPESLPVVNHKDGNKLNNRVENLEWCTHSQNVNHALKTGLAHPAKGVHTKFGRLSRKEVKEIRDLLCNGLSQYKIADLYGVTRGAIEQIAGGKTYKWVD